MYKLFVIFNLIYIYMYVYLFITMINQFIHVLYIQRSTEDFLWYTDLVRHFQDSPMFEV